jgi:hypothetical protein
MVELVVTLHAQRDVVVRVCAVLGQPAIDDLCQFVGVLVVIGPVLRTVCAVLAVKC